MSIFDYVRDVQVSQSHRRQFCLKQRELLKQNLDNLLHTGYSQAGSGTPNNQSCYALTELISRALKRYEQELFELGVEPDISDFDDEVSVDPATETSLFIAY